MRIFLISLFLFGTSQLFALQVKAAGQHQLVRRMVVFPIQVERTYASVAEEIWWDLRAKLTESKRYLVASRNFMESKDVFQPRGELSSADAIILGRLLDAHALITLRLNERKLVLRAYDGREGNLLWERSLELHPSLPMSKQLPNACEKLLYDFLAAIPYQGSLVVDGLAGRAVYKEGDSYRAKMEIGVDTKVNIGDQVQVINFNVVSLEPAFDKGGEVQVLAEGQVVKVESGLVTLQLDRISDVKLIKEGSLVRLPGELKRLQETYSIGLGQQKIEVGFIDNSRKLTDKEKERKPLVTALSFLANLVVILVVAL